VYRAEVRVRQASNDVQDMPCRSSASARRNHLIIQGDSRLECASARAATRTRSACMKEHIGQRLVEPAEAVADELQGGSDTLQAATKPATLRCYRLVLDPKYLEK
jgi:hypothetical protein